LIGWRFWHLKTPNLLSFSGKLLEWAHADKMQWGDPSAWCHFERSPPLQR
jgi:hypothetical protein